MKINNPKEKYFQIQRDKVWKNYKDSIEYLRQQVYNQVGIVSKEFIQNYSNESKQSK